MASKEELLQSINPSMHLNKDFFLKIYGYDLTCPGFSEIALQKLEQEGCSKARCYYDSIKTEWELNHDNELKKASNWYREYLNREEDSKNRKEVSDLRKSLEKMSDSDLLRYAESLISVS